MKIELVALFIFFCCFASEIANPTSAFIGCLCTVNLGPYIAS
jgi:hypothetical protein